VFDPRCGGRRRIDQTQNTADVAPPRVAFGATAAASGLARAGGDRGTRISRLGGPKRAEAAEVDACQCRVVRVEAKARGRVDAPLSGGHSRSRRERGCVGHGHAEDAIVVVLVVGVVVCGCRACS